jgi:hypothetical protein
VRAAAVLASAVTLLSVSGALLATPAAADPADCTSGVEGTTLAYAECPAGAGDFEFRVVAQGAGISGQHTVYGSWQRPAPDAAVRSEIACEYAPKCAITGWSIEFR